jgi:hypothetical protein
MHQGRLAEADLGLRRVDVDVDLLRRHLEEEQQHRERGRRQHVAVGFDRGVQDQPVADEPAINEDVDGVAVELLQFGLRGKAAQAQVAGLGWLVVRVATPGRQLG